ncbi:related to protein disulfide-isomerase precursor [Phialocephala subalpina]|uniref:Related to protein disulfide-isomerase n=1 Tax=Phialocephala subalpina TaxID=576137 RepID=A0A1L7XPV1_9HELO|nr:related to protein disulfide-isomerase precursor [Phialocephala subalpina]
MAEVEEPQFTSLQARIAALNSQGVGKSLNSTGKRPPPPPPPNRPALPSRQTINNPPIATYGSSVTKQSNNEPISTRGQLLPPPPIDRDQPKQIAAKTPPLPARNGPPPLPSRKASQPALPPRKQSAQLSPNPNTQLARRGSNSSIGTVSSTISGMSLSQGSSITSVSSVDSQRKLPPALGDAKLPPLPPTKREREEKAAAEKAARDEKNAIDKAAREAARQPLVTTKSAPVLPSRQPAADRDGPPKMPPRPSGPPKMPDRPVNGRNQTEENVPAQRRLPPPAQTRSILSMGFGNKAKEDPTPTPGPRPSWNNKMNGETPNPAPRPAPAYSRPAGPAVKELNSRNFDDAIEGKFALVDFYAPYCKYCKELDPIYKELGENFAFASDRLVIAKVDVDAHKDFLNKYPIEGYPTILFFDGSGREPEKYRMMRELDSLTEFLEDKTGIKVSDGAHVPKSNGVPPPIPISSKPSMSQVLAVQSRPAPAASPPSGCLLCRDFSGPDGVAAQYPRHSLPRNGDMTGYLADVLCGPFSSATDKARAIFTWLHHNIAYDTVAFFGKTVKHVDPKDTITSGLAVCGGYAGLFSAIALKAGLEAVMVTGHGKGYGYSPLKPGEQCPPPNPAGHAWNAVRIDGGEWKLLDPCWGAGNVGNQVYNKHFSPSEFTKSNEDFGLKHFPQDERYFFRADGRIPSWEEYYLGPTRAEPLQLFGSVEDHGLSATSFTPPQKLIPINSDEVVRFQFSKVCEHWDHEKNGKGKPYCMILKIWGVDGRKEDFVALESNEFWWWADVPAKDLGAAGQTVTLYAVTTVNGKDMRGMTRREYLQKKGKCAMGFGGVAAWDLV